MKLKECSKYLHFYYYNCRFIKIVIGHKKYNVNGERKSSGKLINDGNATMEIAQ